VTGAWRRWGQRLASLVAVVALAAGCAVSIDGTGRLAPIRISVQGDSGDSFDTDAKAALSDVIEFWRKAYPTVADGKSLPPLKGKLYSVDGDELIRTHQVPISVRGNKCLEERPGFIIDNAAYCQTDDSIIWDRGADHLLPVLTAGYGRTLTAMVFAHEFGHAVQHRLGISRQNVSGIDVESQADCAAGAFAGAMLAGDAPHFQITANDLDRALAGYFQIRDSTPSTPSDASHGNGFDRLNAVQQGIESGVKYCFGPDFFNNRTYTERPYVDPNDYNNQGNQPLSQVLGSHGVGPDLNRFWTTAARTNNRTFRPVKLVAARHPVCGGEAVTGQFGYCPDDNTVYYTPSFARQAYDSITVAAIDPHTGAVTLQRNQPGDFALGALIAVAWGMAARHQFFGKSTDDRAGLEAAICYAGAYADDINRQYSDSAHPYILSPPDMDEASSAVLDVVDRGSAFGARGTTGLQRVHDFVTGYDGGLGAC
jgi:predicted metalloprotease